MSDMGGADSLKQLNRNGDERGMSPNSQKNLGKGRLGNNHAKKEVSITRIQRGMMGQSCPYAIGKTWAEWLAERGLALAAENARYYCELLDRLEGKVTLPLGGDKENPVYIINVSSEQGRDNIKRVMRGDRT